MILTSLHPKMEMSNKEIEPTGSKSLVITATNEKVQQDALSRALISLENAEGQRRQKRAETRRPPPPHISRKIDYVGKAKNMSNGDGKSRTNP